MSGPLVLQDHTRYSSDDISNEDLELLQAIQEELEREARNTQSSRSSSS